MVVCLDDVHRADTPTARELCRLVPEQNGPPVLWILARRLLPVRSAGQYAVEWLAGRGAVRIPVGPLRAEDAARLGALLLGARPDPSRSRLISRARGNPLVLRELLCGSGGLAPRNGTAGLAEPGNVGDMPTALMRLAELSCEAQRLLAAGAALTRPFTVDDAAALTGHARAELVRAQSEVLAAGLVQWSGPGLTFRYDVVRDASFDRVPAAAQELLHARIWVGWAAAGDEVAASAAAPEAPPLRRLAAAPGAPRPRAPEARAADAPLAGLTRAEHRVVRLVAEGLTDQAVASRLSVSPHTVDTHLRHAFAKLGVSNRVELTRRVLTKSLVEAHGTGNHENA